MELAQREWNDPVAPVHVTVFLEETFRFVNFRFRPNLWIHVNAVYVARNLKCLMEKNPKLPIVWSVTNIFHKDVNSDDRPAICFEFFYRKYQISHRSASRNKKSINFRIPKCSTWMRERDNCFPPVQFQDCSSHVRQVRFIVHLRKSLAWNKGFDFFSEPVLNVRMISQHDQSPA